MDSFTLSSNGANDLTCNNITSDNISVISSLTVSGTNILSSLGNINTNINNINNDINNINSSIGSTSSSLNITGATNINFNVNNNLFTKINQSGLSVFHDGNSTTFPYTYEGWYNISNRLDSLYQCMNDSVEAIINFDATHNTVIRIREQDIVNQVYYPRQLQIQTYQGTSISKFDIQGLQVLDTNNNWYYINKMFTITNNSTLLCSNKIMVDSSGNLKLYVPVTNNWLNVADNLFSNNSQSITEQINTATNSIIGAVGAIATLGNYYQSLQLTLAVTAGVVVGAGLLLAFTLKQDRFDVKLPLSLRAPVTTNNEYFKQLELKFNTTLLLDTGVLTINTREFLCPLWGDLAMAPTPDNILTSSSLSYVVLKNISQPMTCCSSLNVSGYTTLFSNATCMNNLNINGALYCSSINSETTLGLTNNLNSLSTYSNLNISNLQSTSTTILNNLNSLSSCSILNVNSLNVIGTSVFNNDVTAKSNLYALNIPKKVMFNCDITIPCTIGSTTYYKYDLDLRLYTKVLTIAPTTTTRKFKFMCSIASGAHNSGLYSLNYDIDYSYAVSLTNFNELNVIAYGYPYENMRLDKITPNGLFIWKVDFNYVTIFSLVQINLQCIIIDYL